MSRLESCFRKLRESPRTALIPFLTAGDPTSEMTVSLMHCLVANGADVLELGVPFSDPMADGIVIQRSYDCALANHVTLSRVLDMVAEFRLQDQRTPVVLMGYLNPIEALGYRAFMNEAEEKGVDGVLVVDMPLEEARGFSTQLRQHEIDQIFLISPTTASARINEILSAASGFVYYVSFKGVTGSQILNIDSVEQNVSKIKSNTSLPIAVGFGIKDSDTAMKVGKISDAVVIGSALMDKIYHCEVLSEVHEVLAVFMGSIRRSLDSVAQ